MYAADMHDVCNVIPQRPCCLVGYQGTLYIYYKVLFFKYKKYRRLPIHVYALSGRVLLLVPSYLHNAVIVYARCTNAVRGRLVPLA